MAFDDSEARDESGRWTSGGGGDAAGTVSGLDPAVVEATPQVWGATTAGGLGQNFDSPAEARAYLESPQLAAMGFPGVVEGHEVEQAQQISEQLQSNAIFSYVGPGYQTINGFLRGETEEQSTAAYAEGKIELLDQAIAQQLPTAAESILYRGAGEVHAAEYAAMAPGSQFSDSGFVSASTDRGTAESFASVPGAGTPDYNPQAGSPILAIHAPAGSQGYNVGGGEGEVILPRGSAFQVLGHEGNVTHVALLAG